MKPATEINELLARRIGGETLADLRTVRRVMRGERVRGVVRERILNALASVDRTAPQPSIGT